MYLPNLISNIVISFFVVVVAEQETRLQRISDVHTLVHRLSKANFEMLDIVIRHLKA